MPIFFAKGPECFHSIYENMKVSVRAQKLLRLKTLPRTLRMPFGNPDEVFLPSCRNFFRSRYGKHSKLFLFKELFFHTTFLWIPKNPLWRHCWSFFCQRSQTCFQSYDNEWEYIFPKKYFGSDPANGHVPLQFEQPYWNILVKVLEKKFEV